eukprot:scaffold9050_cov58-Phaeocystis_antarctica.AAC.1
MSRARYIVGTYTGHLQRTVAKAHLCKAVYLDCTVCAFTLFTALKKDPCKKHCVHPGELATKVRYLGVKSATRKVHRCQVCWALGTEPAKVANRPSAADQSG